MAGPQSHRLLEVELGGNTGLPGFKSSLRSLPCSLLLRSSAQILSGLYEVPSGQGVGRSLDQHSSSFSGAPEV